MFRSTDTHTRTCFCKQAYKIKTNGTTYMLPCLFRRCHSTCCFSSVRRERRFDELVSFTPEGPTAFTQEASVEERALRAGARRRAVSGRPLVVIASPGLWWITTWWWLRRITSHYHCREKGARRVTTDCPVGSQYKCIAFRLPLVVWLITDNGARAMSIIQRRHTNVATPTSTQQRPFGIVATVLALVGVIVLWISPKNTLYQCINALEKTQKRAFPLAYIILYIHRQFGTRARAKNDE